MEKSVNRKLFVSVYVILATIQRRGGRLALLAFAAYRNQNHLGASPLKTSRQKPLVSPKKVANGCRRYCDRKLYILLKTQLKVFDTFPCFKIKKANCPR